MASRTQETNGSGQFPLRKEDIVSLNQEINFLQTCNVQTVNIDGDKFWLCAPSELLIDIIQEWERKGYFQKTPEEKQGRFVTYESMLSSGRLRKIDYLWSQAGEGPFAPICGHCLFKDDKPQMISENQDDEGFFRPMLVPLDKDGHWDMSFQADAPDGSLFYGGILRAAFHRDNMSQVAYYIDNGTEVAPSMQMGADVNLYSGGEQSLAWRAFHGILVCTRNCFKTDLRSLYNMGCLPVLRAKEVLA